MPGYMLSIYQPEGPIPAPEVLEKIMSDLGELRQKMKDAGAWVFTAALHNPSTATVVHARGDDILMTDGPFAEGKEYLGGFTIINAPDLDAAIEWGRRLTRVTTLPVEVRPLFGEIKTPE